MDFERPVEAVIPGAQGKILAVLVETAAELNLRTVARLSGVSVAQASRILPPLVAIGLVERREVPPSSLFRLVPDHVAAEAIGLLVRARERVIDAARPIAATSLAIHAAINAADVVTGQRIGCRAAGPDHSQARTLLRQAGKDGAEVEKNLARLLSLKTRAEYEPDAVALSDERRAVERASRCVATARLVAASTRAQ